MKKTAFFYQAIGHFQGIIAKDNNRLVLVRDAGQTLPIKYIKEHLANKFLITPELMSESRLWNVYPWMVGKKMTHAVVVGYCQPSNSSRDGMVNIQGRVVERGDDGWLSVYIRGNHMDPRKRGFKPFVVPMQAANLKKKHTPKRDELWRFYSTLKDSTLIVKGAENVDFVKQIQNKAA